MVLASDSFHVASLVIWVGEKVDEVVEHLNQLSWAECPAPSENGKCIAVLEANTEGELIERIDTIRNLPGIMNAQLVYHAVDDADVDLNLQVDDSDLQNEG